jgi:endonuclease/exonuclease/phosphatase family metal-dependent hydrolase
MLEAAMPKSLRVATYNIHRCVGRDSREDPRRIASVLQALDADIIALQEVAYTPRARYDVLQFLADSLDARPIAGPTLLEPGGRFGNALLTRMDVLRETRIDISVAGREPRGLLQVQPAITHRSSVVMATHLGLSPRERRYQIRRIADLLEATAAEAVILMGDFNEWRPGGAVLRWLHPYFGVPPRTPRTFPSRRPLLPLDRIWVRPTAVLNRLQVYKDPPARTASDHLPLVADITL